MADHPSAVRLSQREKRTLHAIEQSVLPSQSWIEPLLFVLACAACIWFAYAADGTWARAEHTATYLLEHPQTLSGLQVNQLASDNQKLLLIHVEVIAALRRSIIWTAGAILVCLCAIFFINRSRNRLIVKLMSTGK